MFGSDFPFRDYGQLDGVSASSDANPAVISGAYGGFSNAWGAQIMPFTKGTLRGWPFGWEEIASSYRQVLAEVPLAAEQDDLASLFPLLTEARDLPKMAQRCQLVLDRYARHRHALNGLGITVGKARLAFRADECVRCGLCMTGCPRFLIYSASTTFDRLREANRVEYRDGHLAVQVGEDETGPYVVTIGSRSRLQDTIRGDRVFVAAGGVGSTRLVLGSIGGGFDQVELQESQQYVLPLISLTPTSDPRQEDNFTLNQVNVLLDLNSDGVDLSQIHLYPYNPAFHEALPALLRRPWAAPLATGAIERLSAGLGYLPSWASPRVKVRLVRTSRGQLPEICLSEGQKSAAGLQMYARVMALLLRAAPKLDLWPLVPGAYRSGPAKSYHFGGSFPHHERHRHGPWTTDRTGRLERWKSVHLVDAAVFPTVPATTFTLTVMANAHRIATEVAGANDA
jgi:ferredoxin